MAQQTEPSRGEQRKRLRRTRSNRIERAWARWVESHPPYRPGDLMPEPREKKRKKWGS